MTDIINQANLASDQADFAFEEARKLFDSVQRGRDNRGIYKHHDMIPGEIDRVIYALARVQTIIINTQWPKAADWLEV